MEQLMILLGTFLFPPLLLLVLLVVILASFGKSFGIRHKYVAILLIIFEWGSKQVRREIKQLQKASGEANDGETTTTDEDSLEANDIDDGQRSKIQNDRRQRYGSGKLGIIRREGAEHILAKLNSDKPINSRIYTIADDALDFTKAGIEAIIEDQVTSRFQAEQLASWNLLMRTGGSHQYLNLKRLLNGKVMLMSNRILSRSVSTIITFRDRFNMAQNGGICVANHTSPIDVMILSIDNVYALIGQSHGGFLGIVQRALSRSSYHIWFERSEGKDRALVIRRLKEHTSDPNKLPILIFPEGTCINNTSVMMFKKGSFEVGSRVYPIAMKYDPRFGDPFWNSSEQSWFEYLMRMMTSWAIICQVWYLPPMDKQSGEDAVSFANRVKRAIAKKGGLVDLEWDGQLKRQRVPTRMVVEQQNLYWRRLNRSGSVGRTGEKMVKRMAGRSCGSISKLADDDVFDGKRILKQIPVHNDDEDDPDPGSKHTPQ